MTEEFKHILDECIERVLQGESLEQCLQRYPQHRAQLEPLLRVAIATRQATSVEPRPEYRLKSRQQLRSVLYGEKSKARSGRVGIFEKVGSGINSIIGGFGGRPVLQKALAGILVIAIVVGLSLTLPALFDQSPVALAEEIAMEDPGVQAQLAETGFEAAILRTTAVRSEDEKNIYFVYFIDPKDGLSIGTVTVDIKSRTVTDKSFIQSVKALAEKIAIEDTRVQAKLAETAIDAARVSTTAVRSEDEANIYFVQFVNTKDGSSIGTVTVDIKSRTVTAIKLASASVQQLVP